MSDSAIQTDVPDTTNTDIPQEVQKSARELAMEAPEQRHQTQMAAANGYELPGDDNADVDVGCGLFSGM